MSLKGFVWIGSFSVIFLFLPSLASKTWDYLTTASWPAKSWLIYFLLAVMVVWYVRKRIRKRNRYRAENHTAVSALDIVKERLAKGEISVEEFRTIREELKS